MKPLNFSGFYDVTYLTEPCGCPYSVWFSAEVFRWCYGSPCFDFIQSREGGLLVSIAWEARHNNFDEPTLFRAKALGESIWINVVKKFDQNGSPYLLVFFPTNETSRQRWRWPPPGAHGEI